jgi:predicted dinucleotide-binding enzyme
VLVITSSATIAIIGFGSTGSAYGRELAQRGYEVQAFDLKLQQADSLVAMRQLMEISAVAPMDSLAAVVRNAKLVLTAVPCAARASLNAEISLLLIPGQYLLDVHSEAATLRQGLGLDAAPPPLKTNLSATIKRGELP